jgi:hypothetical protein
LNALNRVASKRAGALRVAIHPNDLELRLAADLCGYLNGEVSRDLVGER